MKKKIILTLWLLFIFVVLSIISCFILIEKGKIGYMPALDELSNPIDKYASQVYSSDGKLLGTWSQKENRIFVAKDSISPYVFQALVATEDVRFYDHAGIDFRALGRAIVKRGFLRKKSAGGGSTITQQLAKQLYSSTAPSTFKRLLQKPIEWAIAVEIEKHYTKEEILTLYLNYFDFLHNAVGIKTASKVYFNKNPKQLNIQESAMLIGMCKNPSYFNPISDKERAKKRRNVVFDQMVKAGYLSAVDADSLKLLDLGLHFKRLDHKAGIAPYMRDYLRRIMMAEKPNRDNYASWQKQEYYSDSLSWATNPLYGWCNKNKKRDGTNYNIYTDGLKIYTTIDSRMQIAAEESLYGYVAKYLQKEFNREKRNSPNYPFSIGTSLKQIKSILSRSERQSDRYRNLKMMGASDEEIYKSFHTKVPMSLFTYHGEVDTIMTPLDSIKYYKSFLRSALLSIEPQSGYIKAYVGGIDFTHFQYDMAMVGRRQVGSTIKPFVYSMAMEDGMTPNTTIPNVQRSYGGWMPRNGSRSRYGEDVPLSWGLANSNNWVTANLMANIDPTGHRLLDFLKDLGVSSYNIYPSMALCLGPCEITVAELASAYTSFVNKGIRSAPILVQRIEDSEGNVIAEFAPQMNEVMSENSSYEMLKMLQGVVDHGTGSRLRYRFKLEGDIAGKTGTTNKNSDGWFVGIIPRLVTACWVGGDDATIHFNSTSLGQGASTALPIVANYLTAIYKNKSLGYSNKEKFDYPIIEYASPISIEKDSISNNNENQRLDIEDSKSSSKSSFSSESLFK